LAGGVAVVSRASVNRQVARKIEPSTEHDLVTRQIIDSAFAVHRTLGHGHLNSVYEQCLAYELETRDLTIQRQVMLPVRYRNISVEDGFRMDMVVSNLVVVEIKAIERTLPIHQAQLLTYLKLSGHRIGLLINFNVILIKHGIRRLILEHDPCKWNHQSGESCDQTKS
jgi:GxxExxY protein